MALLFGDHQTGPPSCTPLQTEHLNKISMVKSAVYMFRITWELKRTVSSVSHGGKDNPFPETLKRNVFLYTWKTQCFPIIFRQLWRVSGVKLMEVNSNLLPTFAWFFYGK